MDVAVDYYFNLVIKNLENKFGDDIDMQGVLFLIGLQELGKGKIKLSKNEKLDVMHVAICSLLAPFGYYEFEGYDQEGWPHWKVNEKLPALKPLAQQNLMKQAIVDYFNENNLLEEKTV